LNDSSAVANSPHRAGFITSVSKKSIAALQPYVHNSFVCSFDGNQVPPDLESIKYVPNGGSRIFLVKHGFGIPGQKAGYHLFLQGPLQKLDPMDLGNMKVNQVLGVEIRVGALKTVLGIAADEVKNGLIPFEALWGSRAAGILDRLENCGDSAEQLFLLETELALQVGKTRQKDSFVLEAAKYIDRQKGQGTLKSFFGQTGYSQSQVFRKFEEHLGFSPKAYARVVRFKNLLMESMSGARPDWAFIASEYGYYDQAHLAHDFYKITGMYPEGFYDDFRKRGSFVPDEIHKQLLIYRTS
jgi:AraC-like DNA-binding protein